MKRIFIIHGYTGSPNFIWYPWLKAELQKHSDLHVESLKMPSPNFPRKKAWLHTLQNAIGEVDENTYLVGHSLGGITILHYLEGLPEDKKLGGIVLVGAPYSMPVVSLQNTYYRILLASFFKNTINLQKVKQHIVKAVIVHGNKDKIVPFSQGEHIAKELGAPLVVVKNGGHFVKNTVPEVLEAVLKLTTVS